MKEIITDYITIDKEALSSTDNIENILNKHFNNILRWAVVSVDEKVAKICTTYEK